MLYLLKYIQDYICIRICVMSILSNVDFIKST